MEDNNNNNNNDDNIEEKKNKKDNNDAAERLEIFSEHKIRSENLPFDIDVWYPRLKNFTFKTVFRPLTQREAVAIMNYYKKRYMEKKGFCREDILILDELEKDIQAILEKDFLPKGAFLRLAGRSPKDAEPYDRNWLIKKYKTEIKRMIEEKKYPNDANTKYMAIMKTNYLKITNAKEAMSLILTSERVFADLHDWLKYGEKEQIVLRDFEESITIDFEFRGYVYKNKLNAISQYDHYGVYPYLKDLKETILNLILEKFEEVHPHVGEDSYCIDFAYIESTKEVVVVELSPFLNCTGPACFSWKNDLDILQGNAPFEFRLNEKSHPHLKELLEVNWEDRWSGKYSKYHEFYYHLLSDEEKSIVETLNLSRPKTKSDMKSMVLLGLCVSIIFNIFYCYIFNYDLNQQIIFQTIICSILFTITFSILSNITTNQSKQIPYNRLFFSEKESIKIKNSLKLENKHFIFFYGTLKNNFHWNRKYLTGASFISPAKTIDLFPLCVGESGVPYVLGDHVGQGNHIIGELWKVNDDLLEEMDEYEGIDKGYYIRKKISISLLNNDNGNTNNNNDNEDDNLDLIDDIDMNNNNNSIDAWIYVLAKSNEELRNQQYLPEYTLQIHLNKYKPIRHINVKQEKYLGVEHNRT